MHEVEELCLALQRNCTGAHAHCASKAESYLRSFTKKKTGFTDGSYDRFVMLIRKAVYSDEWKALDDRMARWF